MPDPSTSFAALSRSLAAAGYAVESWHRLTGDVSPRVYYRTILGRGDTAVVATYPAGSRAGCRRFERSTQLLQQANVQVPEIYAADCTAGWMLMEDLGDETLFDRRHLGWDELLPHLQQAAEIQQRISTLPVGPIAALNPPLDSGLLKRELQQTWDLLLVPRQLTGDADLTKRLRQVLDRLCDVLGEATAVPAHRDFMSRNLVPAVTPHALALIDHQDLRLAPPFYDLASLLNDSLFPPPEIEEGILLSQISDTTSLLGYRRAAVQRTLKAVGTFAAFAQRGFSRHLQLVGPTLSRTLHHLAALPEGAAMAEWLQPIWEPTIARR